MGLPTRQRYDHKGFSGVSSIAGDIERVSYDTKLRRTFYLPKWEYVESFSKYAESEQGPGEFQMFHDKHCPCRTVLALVPPRK